MKVILKDNYTKQEGNKMKKGDKALETLKAVVDQELKVICSDEI